MNFFENTSASFSRRAFLGASALSAAALLAACKKKDSDGAQGGSSDTDSKFRTLDDMVDSREVTDHGRVGHMLVGTRCHLISVKVHG